MPSFVTLERRDSVALIKIDRPPVNALSRDVLHALLRHIQAAAETASCEILVLYGQGRTFVCGADITELDQPDNDLFGMVMNTLESLQKPVVCALHGTTLGAGLELAMACHYRIADAATTLGLPEVKLGILPGAGGTQRLPRLAGPSAALDMMISGRPIPASQALTLGLVDQISQGDLLDAAIAYARILLRNAMPPRPTRNLPIATDDTFHRTLAQALAQADATPAYPARRAIVQCMQAAIALPFTQGLAQERRHFEICRRSETSIALRHLFLAERAASKIPGLATQPAPHPIRRVAIVGAGTMGRGIALNFLRAGIATLLIDIHPDALASGIDQIRRTLDGLAVKGSITHDKATACLSLLQTDTNDAALSGCDLIIEAAFEDRRIKAAICERIGALARPGAILATNTSTLDVNMLAAASGRPDDFLGMHFFSPAHIMPLLEVVRGERTTPEVLQSAMQLAKQLRKTPVVSGVCFGFIGNRMLESYLREVDFLLMEGATPRQVDQAMEAFGFAMGPCRVMDMAGIDISASILQDRAETGGLPDDPSYRAIVRRLGALGRNGQKTRRGYYLYDGRTPVDDTSFPALATELASAHGIIQRDYIDDQEIIERCLFPLINEGARILEEGIASRPGDIDVVWIRGYGFPDHRGGPMFMADRIGPTKILARLAHYAATRGDRHAYWTPSTLLHTCAVRALPIAKTAIHQQ